MEYFDGREAFQLKARVKLLQRAQHVRVIAEGQRRVQPADDMHLGDADGQRLAGLLHNLLDGMLEAVGVTFLAGEGAELAGEDAVVRVVDVAVDDVAGAIAGLSPANEVRDSAGGVEILALEQPQGVFVGNALASDFLFINVTQPALLQKEIHRTIRKPGNTTSASVTTRKTTLTTALSLKKAVSIHFKLRRRASQCSSNRQTRMKIRPQKYATRKPQSKPNNASRPHISRCEINAAASAFCGPQATTSEWSFCRR